MDNDDDAIEAVVRGQGGLTMDGPRVKRWTGGAWNRSGLLAGVVVLAVTAAAGAEEKKPFWKRGKAEKPSPTTNVSVSGTQGAHAGFESAIRKLLSDAQEKAQAGDIDGAVKLALRAQKLAQASGTVGGKESPLLATATQMLAELEAKRTGTSVASAPAPDGTLPPSAVTAQPPSAPPVPAAPAVTQAAAVPAMVTPSALPPVPVVAVPPVSSPPVETLPPPAPPAVETVPVAAPASAPVIAARDLAAVPSAPAVPERSASPALPLEPAPAAPRSAPMLDPAFMAAPAISQDGWDDIGDFEVPATMPVVRGTRPAPRVAPPVEPALLPGWEAPAPKPFLAPEPVAAVTPARRPEPAIPAEPAAPVPASVRAHDPALTHLREKLLLTPPPTVPTAAPAEAIVATSWVEVRREASAPPAPPQRLSLKGITRRLSDKAEGLARGPVIGGLAVCLVVLTIGFLSGRSRGTGK